MRKSMRTLGIDIGGANIKLSDSAGKCLSVPFPMWNACDSLAETIRALIERFDTSATALAGSHSLAVTMTGELADCFATRREGVACILEQIAMAAPKMEVSVYAVGGHWFSLDEAQKHPWEVAASNWYALAEWLLAAPPPACGEFQLVVDVGSTTVDVIPVVDRRIATDAKTDRERMQAGQLVYTGMERTPVAAILNSFTLDDSECPVMAERFATSDDAYVALGLVPERSDECDTADGRPRTKPCARGRLARMVGEDSETLSPACIDTLADQVISAQASQIAKAIERNLPSGPTPSTLLISGHGRPLLDRVRDKFLPSHQYQWLDECISPQAARCGPALAVAWLLENRVWAAD